MESSALVWYEKFSKTSHFILDGMLLIPFSAASVLCSGLTGRAVGTNGSGQ